MKVLVVKTSSMGDVIHTLPALTDAQQAIPDIQFDWVIEENFSEIPHWHSAVDKVVPLAIRRWRKNLCKRQTWLEWQNYLKQLRSTEYDAVIDAQGLIKSAVFATKQAKGTKYGYDKHSAREGLSSLFYDHSFNIAYQQHAVERIRQLFAMSLNYTLPDRLGDYGIATHFAKKNENSTAYVLAIHATTRADKHWKEEYWREVIQELSVQGVEVRLPWGNAQEKARAIRLAQANTNVTVLPKLSLTELAEQISGAKVVLSVDTGLSHLAAALDKPNVILYGTTDPKLIGAYGKNQHYLTGHGMANILPYRVLQTLETLITE
ncbi:lipopolysaccharide heptosyltransferase RfaC [Actinobacillus pleuropneumoniae]|uniref:Lipopolysaccharide heptosyltransferase 1 n=1 Tax=Actinobacillus pleuropneumoniae TaxID=715 RepID=A0A9Q4DJM7_ACTPL|nr:lipopolysaccharide heptosyltransferase RfaC [Actinobacillus pleuropneumoniae]MCL7722176.1 lipopolysaccharide heptosyltransferase RfaC [Actinobacillus pleuropneumoniae]MCL7728397.1 lipopolysaccharide heptosyltransferase RfaC [Actinobacillus pleuropneumoniae]MCL7730488.1 lipopolysaccharide heptosyltransferase RfaC [Actinobacillus pleuropneumoniae]MCY6368412.1 lipopolysaccharide heptosyltransferase RfaC [Actinobacillus pleuropneumoniae]MCY6385282.1 lipopolysaccharide heptosyltransferase RfaC [